MSDIKPEAVAQEPVANIPSVEVATTDAAPAVAEPAVAEPAVAEPAVAATEEKAANGTEQTEGEKKDTFQNRGQDRGPRVFKKYQSKSKFDPSKLPITDDPSEIRAQVDFYFGDSNLPTDEFMLGLTGGPENKPVLLKEVHKFGRMKRFQPYEAIVEALKTSTVVEISGEAGEEVVKRKVALKAKQGSEGAEHHKAKEARSVYAKGFGDEEATTQFDIEAFFSQYGPTNAVRLRRDDESKAFKGSVYVEFSTEELAKTFLALDPKPKFKGEHELEIMSKGDYVVKCNKEIADGTRKPKETKSFNKGGRGRGGRDSGRGGRGGGDRGDRDSGDWKRRRDDDQKGGFRDNKRGRGGRGGRGGGRGGNPNREARGPRPDNNRNEERNAETTTKASVDPTYANNATRPDAAAAPAVEENKKRAREDDGSAAGAPAKKVDNKEAPAASL